MPDLLCLYPQTLPLRTHALHVSGGHVLHVEESGNAHGTAAVVLHGGPGSGFSPLLRRYFNPDLYRVVCIDQRGCGRSLPMGEVAHNTTPDLLDDLHAVRQHLEIDRWLVVGGSWGASLAIAHAFREPQAVSGLLLRSLFLARPQDVAWFFQGARELFPTAWARFASLAPAACAHDLLSFFADELTQRSTASSQPLALAWWQWEQVLAGQPPINETELAEAAKNALVRRYRVQGHYLRHACWLADPSVLQMCGQLAQRPTLLLHGDDDRICGPAQAQAAHRLIQGSRFKSIAGAGHDPTHPAMVHAMVGALDCFAHSANFDRHSTRAAL